MPTRHTININVTHKTSWHFWFPCTRVPDCYMFLSKWIKHFTSQQQLLFRTKSDLLRQTTIRVQGQPQCSPDLLGSTWFENFPSGRTCMGVLQALARAKGHIIPVSAFMPLLMASWTSILEGLSSPTRVVVVLCVLYIVVEVVLRGTTTIWKHIFCRKICMLFKKMNLFFHYFIYFLIPFVGKQKNV